MLDNGGPLLDDAAPKLRWIKLNISEFLEGVDELTYEQRGFYITALLKMYARHNGIPVDDREGAHAMGCNPRTFRVHKAMLLEAGKFYVADGMLRNKRFDYELAEFTRQTKKRREAALKRERERRDAITAYTTDKRSAPIRTEFEPNSSPIRAEFTPNSVPKNEEKPTKSTCAAQQVWREPEPEPEPEPERKNNCLPNHATREPAADRQAVALKEVFNGSTDSMLTDAAKWMGLEPGSPYAAKWLQSTLTACGADATARAYAALCEKQARNEPIANPITWWAKTAVTMKANAPKPKRAKPGFRRYGV
jgi:uncharacterized protein YdaU (DUF1376 family)